MPRWQDTITLDRLGLRQPNGQAVRALTLTLSHTTVRSFSCSFLSANWRFDPRESCTEGRLQRVGRPQRFASTCLLFHRLCVWVNWPPRPDSCHHSNVPVSPSPQVVPSPPARRLQCVYCTS